MALNGFVMKFYQRVQSVADAADTTIAYMTDQYDIDTVTLNVKNNGSAALDTAKLQFKSHPDAGWVTVESTAWATADNIVVSANNLQTLGATTEMVVKFKTDGVYAWRILAQGNAAATGPIEVWGVCNGVPKSFSDAGTKILSGSE